MTTTQTVEITAEEIAEADRDLEDAKNQARAIAGELQNLGYDVFLSCGLSHGLTEWDIYEAGNGTPQGQVGSVWYDGCGPILKGDRLQSLAGSGKLRTWPMV